jgi:glycosyltransferase involved in cell wall biosynthesis
LNQAYGLTHHIPLRRLPVLDLQFLGPIGYRLTAFQFILESLLYLWLKVFKGERFIVYTVDMDPFSFAPLCFVPRPLYAEMHGVKKPNLLRKRFFERAQIIATNNPIAEELTQTFHIPPERLLIEPNGVDESVLQNTLSKEDARRLLGLKPEEPFALYVGRFYAWKGLEILADAAKNSPIPIYVVGGTREEYEHITKKSGDALHFIGAKPVSEVPTWLAAADVLLLIGTARNNDSYLHTAPMKTFEYLAARRPTVVARTPSMKSIMAEDTACWYEPDDAHSLGRAIQEAYTSPRAKTVVAAGLQSASEHTWRKRAERILSFSKQHILR